MQDESKQQIHHLTNPAITEGSMVEVERRMWPGMNKPGGFAKVTKIHLSVVIANVSDNRYSLNETGAGGNKVESSKISHVDVWYPVEGRKEINVPIGYVKPASHLQAGLTTEDAGRRKTIKRSILGRCTRCRSLRQDCGSCDWLEEQRLRDLIMIGNDNHWGEAHKTKNSDSVRRKRKITNKTQMFQENIESGDDDSQSLSSSEDEAWNRAYAEYKACEKDSSNAKGSINKRGDNSVGASSGGESTDDDILDFVPFRRYHQKLKSNVKEPSILETLGIEGPVSAVDNILRGRPDRPLAYEENDIPSQEDEPPQMNSTQIEESVPMLDFQFSQTTSSPNDAGDFIQPETLPERLPKDIVDRSKDVAYIDLPKFFDELVGNIESDLIPDTRIKLALLRAEMRRARSELSLASFDAEMARLYQKW